MDVDAEITVPDPENRVLSKIQIVNPGLGQNIAVHASPTSGNLPN